MTASVRGRRSIRLRGYEYTQPGAYFITICTQGRACLFGEVVEGGVVQSAFGRMVAEEWSRTGELRQDVQVDEFIVMPNHVHGILVLVGRGTARRAPTRARPAAVEQAAAAERFGVPIGGSVPTIIRAIKSAVTKRINVARQTPGARVWQRGYSEHVVRDEESLRRICEYIAANPTKWLVDSENPVRQVD